MRPRTPRLLRALLRALALVLGLLGAHAAQAVCIVGCSCNVAVTSVVFAPINPLQSANTDSTGNIRVSCSGGAGVAIVYAIAFSAGASNNAAARTMVSGTAKLAYNLYTSNTYATIWGDGTGSGVVVNGGVLLDVLGSSTPQDYTVYGRVPGPQSSVAPGAYSDSLVVTLTYF
jgi:spore coat protein U-like protein